MNKITLNGATLSLEYDLFDLPTAQHKAGLAGMILMIESLKQRYKRKMKPLPMAEVKATSARIEFTKDSMQTVFNDLYAAKLVEVEVKQKWKGKPPKDIKEIEVETDGKIKKEKRFVYEAVQPSGDFLQAFYPDGNGAWIKLWRDMLWNILRGIPATRKVFEERANEKISSEGAKCWKAMVKAAEARKKGKAVTAGISSAIYVGAEDKNAERVPFKGEVENNFLLNFWPVVSLIYVPRSLDIERSENKWRIRRNEAGYVLAIPEPYDLETFAEDAVSTLRGLKTEIAGFRPRSALIDIFEEGGLEYLYQFARKKTEDKESFAFSLCATELYHLQKQGNRIRQLAAARLEPSSQIIEDYETMRDSFRNPFYKKISLRNLLDGNPWYKDADSLFQHHPMPIFIYKGITPGGMRFFGLDARNKFISMKKRLEQLKGGNTMSEKEVDDQLTLRIYRLIQTYVRLRTEEKSQKKYKDFKDNRDENNRIKYPPEYREAVEKVCTDAFLAMRGRREQDYVEYFTGTICSVPQFLPESEFVSVAKVLTEDWQRVKNISMLALSACSYLSGTSD